jgi:hypothetical protein
MKWVTCGLDGGYENAYRVLVGKDEGKRPPGRHMCRWEDSIKIGLK